MAIEIPSNVSDRLAQEQNIWLTTTKADGSPLPNVVWFLWHGGEFLVLTDPGSVKMKAMRRNAHVSLHLNSSSVDGSDVAIFQALAKPGDKPITTAELDAYLKKYADGMTTLGLTKEMLDSYQLVRIKPEKFRTVTY